MRFRSAPVYRPARLHEYERQKKKINLLSIRVHDLRAFNVRIHYNRRYTRGDMRVRSDVGRSDLSFFFFFPPRPAIKCDSDVEQNVLFTTSYYSAVL